MGDLSPFLRNVQGGHAHWCPGCEEMHRIPDRWTFDGNVTSPTFQPSVKITGIETIKVNGVWTGEWVKDANGNGVPYCCHYFLHAGVLKFCSDSTHRLAGQNVPLPPVPVGIASDGYSQ